MHLQRNAEGQHALGILLTRLHHIPAGWPIHTCQLLKRLAVEEHTTLSDPWHTAPERNSLHPFSQQWPMRMGYEDGSVLVSSAIKRGTAYPGAAESSVN